jgi:hypothetical protein
VIVREKGGSYVLIKQHEHGLISGEFARHWDGSIRPLKPTLYAIANHDIAWQTLDEPVRWNEETGKPYSFMNYPIQPRLQAYEEGLNFLESQSPYAACLCSMHYAALVRGSELEVRFWQSEARRQRKIKDTMTWEGLGNLEHNLRLLRLCDDMSLFVCLNEPGRNDYPWYKNGFEFEGSKFEPVWEDSQTLRLEPNPFVEAFELAIPYTLVGEDGRSVASKLFGLRVTC